MDKKTENRKPSVREVIVVEGRYDKNTLSQVVDALIFETGGFALFNRPDRIRALRTLAEKRGVVILTDSDGAGFVIRNHLKGMLPGVELKNAFIPAVPGKESRKRRASKEGLLGVEGMESPVILEALRRAGACMDDGERLGSALSSVDFYQLGLSGCTGAEERRRQVAESLGLPGGMSQSDLRRAIGYIMSREELRALLEKLQDGTSLS
ncbi:MAG: DUF4093 domain-containing protein [Oscillospiraceae bacterium]|nr:DUF4093 domain-containing protein [Oscillospiraceae bacterium]